MNLIPNTTCRRCHRPYPSYKSRCPYCGTKKERETRRAAPPADSAVKGTEAARNEAENINWQMMIGGVLLACIMIVTIVIVSSTVKSYVPSDDTTADAEATPLTEITPVPTATAEPSPSPTPITVTSITIIYGSTTMADFTEGAGVQIDLDAQVYPADQSIEVTWTSSDESVATVDQDGVVTMISSGAATITASAGGLQAQCIARCSG